MAKNILPIILFVTIFLSCQNKSNESIIQSNQFLINYKNELYSELLKRNAYEEEKVKDLYEKFQKFKNQSDNLINKIYQLQNNNRELNPIIDTYLEILKKTLLRSEHSSHINKIVNEFLQDYNNISKEELINRILIIDVTVLNEILKSIDFYDFKFDVIQNVTFSDNQNIHLGDSFELKIGLLANNKHSPNKVIIGKFNDKRELIERYDTLESSIRGYNIYKILPKTRGKHVIQGVMQIFQGDKQLNYPFYHTYEVK